MKQEIRKASEGLLGHLNSPRTQVKEIEVKGKIVRGISKSPRGVTTVVWEHNLGTRRLKIFQQEVEEYLILEGICLILGQWYSRGGVLALACSLYIVSLFLLFL